MSRAIYWIGTVFLDRCESTTKVEENLQRLGAVYGIYQLECGEETNNPHWQIYTILGSRRRVSELTREFPGSHWECRRGSHSQAKDYCSKDDATRIDGPFTFGTEPENCQPGRRSDLLALREALRVGKSDAELWCSEDTFGAMLKYHRSIPIARSAICPDETRCMPAVYILWGPPGTGKSARCEAYAQKLNQATYRVSSPMGRTMPVWWDGYIGQPFIIFDDFYGWVQFTKVLKLCDRYQERVDYRGGSCLFRGVIICFTSNTPPNEWWKSIGTERYQAFQRRITKEFNVTSLDQVCDPFPTLDFGDDENTQPLNQ